MVDGVTGEQLADNTANLGSLLRGAIATLASVSPDVVRLVYLNTSYLLGANSSVSSNNGTADYVTPVDGTSPANTAEATGPAG